MSIGWPTRCTRAIFGLILDVVPDHTSGQHPWFIESRSSRGNSKRDWYVWADPGQDGGPPNNWLTSRPILLATLPPPAAGPYWHDPEV
jgi:alpha-glucosidase